MTVGLLCLAVLACIATPEVAAQLSAVDAAAMMGRGINLGNTLEPYQEGGWNNGPAQEVYFDECVTAGFQSVRIPVRWDGHTSTSPPYSVADTWMDRVEEVVDWALDRDLFVILNAHHDDWLKQNYGDPDIRARFDSIWVQIAERFQSKSDKLLFEILNEPFGMSLEEVDDLNRRILQLIRRSNPTRIVVYSGNEYTGMYQLMQAGIPSDPYVIGYFHHYDPWSFAGLGQGTWGSEADRDVLHQNIGLVAEWSDATGIPVVLSEFGAVLSADFNSRMRFYDAYVEELVSYGMPFQVWDDGGQFDILIRPLHIWRETKDILIHTYPDGPGRFQLEENADHFAELGWQNRGQYDAIVVERAYPKEDFETLAVLQPDADVYTDDTAIAGVQYLYRVVGKNAGDGDRYSHPLQLELQSIRSAFPSRSHAVPGAVEAEDFDRGGEGISYHDADGENYPGAYRTDVGVDIESRSDGGYHIGYVEAGEWLEYSIEVAYTGAYRLTAELASLNGGGRIGYQFGNDISSSMDVPSTGDWQMTTTVETTVNLPAGRQIFRISIEAVPEYNIDRIDFEYLGNTAVSGSTRYFEESRGIHIYPNPAHGRVRLAGDASLDVTTVEFFDLLGRRVLRADVTGDRSDLDIGRLTPGTYLVRRSEASGLTTRSVLTVY